MSIAFICSILKTLSENTNRIAPEKKFVPWLKMWKQELIRPSFATLRLQRYIWCTMKRYHNEKLCKGSEVESDTHHSG